MKKSLILLVLFISVVALQAQSSDALTNRIPVLRVSAMGGVYSLIETSNYADFPQRLLTGQEGAWIGRDNGSSWGLVRFQMNNFLDLPMPMAWQISAEGFSELWLDQVFDHVGLTGFGGYDPFGQFGMAAAGTSRINSYFAMGLNKDLLVGLGLKLYSNSNSFADDNTEFDHSFWGLETTWGGTMILDESHFIDASMNLDFWSWDGSYKVNNVDLYEFGYTKCDGIFNFGLNGRYYVTGQKVDYAPYMKFNYFSFSAVEGVQDVDPVTAGNQNGEFTYDGSLFNFTLGTGVHYKPVEGVKVYNDFEFRYQSTTQVVDQGNKQEDSQSGMSLLPIYRMGVEIVKEVDPKIWWGFTSVQLWGGFNKTFFDIWTKDEQGNDTVEQTLPTDEEVNVTTGAALQNGNFKFEFMTTIGNLGFEDGWLDNVSLGLTYLFR